MLRAVLGAMRWFGAGSALWGTLAQHQAIVGSCWGPAGAELGQLWASEAVSV